MEVRARTSTVGSPAAGFPLASRLLRIEPKWVLRSSHAAVPSATPISMLPRAVSTCTEPGPTSARRTLPFAVLATTVPPARSTAMLPFAELTRRSFATSPSLVVAVGVLDHRVAVDAVDPQRAGARRQLGIARRVLDGDVTRARLELRRTRLGDVHVAGSGLEAGVTESPGGAQRGRGRVAAELRARRHRDLDVDRLAPAEEREGPPPLRPLDEQLAVGELDARLLRGGRRRPCASCWSGARRPRCRCARSRPPGPRPSRARR